MTDCPNATIRDRLPDLVHGTLAAPSRAEVEAHLATCGDCARELALLRAARATMARSPEVDVARIVAALPRPGAAGPRLVQVPVAAAPTRPPRRAGPARWAALAAAAVLALAVGVGSATLRDDAPAAAAPPAITDAAPAAAPAGRVAPAETRRASDVQPAAGARDAAAAPLLVVNTAALSDADLAGLLDELDELEAMPAVDPVSLVPVAELPADVGTGAEL